MRYFILVLWRRPRRTILFLSLSLILSAAGGVLLAAQERSVSELCEVTERIEVSVSLVGNEPEDTLPQELLDGLLSLGMLEAVYLEAAIPTVFGPSTTSSEVEHILTNDPLRCEFLLTAQLTFAPGWDASVFAGSKAVCLVDQNLMDKLGLTYGDTVRLGVLWQVTQRSARFAQSAESTIALSEGEDFTIIGSYTLPYGTSQRVYLPIASVTEHISYYYDGSVESPTGADEDEIRAAFAQRYLNYTRAEFSVTDNHRLDDLREFLRTYDKKGLLFLDDYQFLSVTVPMKSRALMLKNMILPYTLLGAMLLSGASILGVLSSRKTAALLRLLGVSRLSVLLGLVMEQMLPLLTGVAVVYAVCPVRLRPILAVFVVVPTAACIVAAACAAFQSPMASLQTKE